MSTRILCRVDGVTAQTLIHPDNLALGMRGHLEHDADLISVLMQIQSQQRTYVLLDGCPGCLYRRCRPGCRVLLFGRTLRAAGGSPTTLVPITEGLAPRCYTRMALAWPRRHAPMLTADLLHPYPEARLLLHWRHRRLPRPTLTLAALLMVGADGPDPADPLRTAGWWARSLPPACHALWTTPTPRGLFPGTAWRGDPSLLLPQDIHAVTGGTTLLTPDVVQKPAAAAATLAHRRNRTCRTTSHPADPTDLHRLAETESAPDAAVAAIPLLTYAILTAANQAILRGLTIFAAPETATESPASAPSSASTPADSTTSAQAGDDSVLITPPPPPSIWPAGPGTGKSAMNPGDVGMVVERILASETILAGPTPGLSRKRLVALLPEIWKEHTQILLAWCDAAGMLDAPRDPADPWRYARPLILTDPEQIAARLQATAIPSKE